MSFFRGKDGDSVVLLHPDMYRYYYPDFTDDAILDAVAVLLGDYAGIRKKAAHAFLKLALKSFAFKMLMNQISTEAPVVDRNDPRVRVWKNQVLKVGRCEICGSKENLQAHHIAYWSEAPLDRINVTNGMCLCAACHANEHKGEEVYPMMLAGLGDSYG